MHKTKRTWQNGGTFSRRRSRRQLRTGLILGLIFAALTGCAIWLIGSRSAF
jgi:hypothetical protein